MTRSKRKPVDDDFDDTNGFGGTSPEDTDISDPEKLLAGAMRGAPPAEINPPSVPVQRGHIRRKRGVT